MRRRSWNLRQPPVRPRLPLTIAVPSDQEVPASALAKFLDQIRNLRRFELKELYLNSMVSSRGRRELSTALLRIQSIQEIYLGRLENVDHPFKFFVNDIPKIPN